MFRWFWKGHWQDHVVKVIDQLMDESDKSFEAANRIHGMVNNHMFAQKLYFKMHLLLLVCCVERKRLSLFSSLKNFGALLRLKYDSL
jgi:hypothetical protein